MSIDPSGDHPPQDLTADTSLSPESFPADLGSICPVCGGTLISEKCKVICRSERCRYRIVFNCAEF
jgi:hypothetical protein